jgi:CRP/FNR family cyclic AMP-dependent transcriptional regulator
LSTFAQQLLQSLKFSNARILASLSDLTLMSYDIGDLILQKGHSIHSWQFVISGYVAASQQLHNGKHLQINLHAQNTWFGEQALLSHQPSLHDYTCLSPVELLVMGKNCFTKALLEEPDFVRFLAQHLARESLKNSEMLTLMRMSSPPLRIVMGLAQFAEAQSNNRHRPDISHQPDSAQSLDIGIAQNKIAELCGVSRTLFSQYVQHLARDGWLKLRYGGIELQSMDTWCIFARHQREQQRVFSNPTMTVLLNALATAHEELGPRRFPNLINKLG